jgi:ABC-type bacteriocin/lantibiotic exporter with double-glycine peptidase domain
MTTILFEKIMFNIIRINISRCRCKEFIAFIIVFSQLLRPISGISFCVSCLNKAKVSQDRINEILETDEKIYESSSPVPLPVLAKGIRYQNIRFKYFKEQRNKIQARIYYFPTRKYVTLTFK